MNATIVAARRNVPATMLRVSDTMRTHPRPTRRGTLGAVAPMTEAQTVTVGPRTDPQRRQLAATSAAGDCDD